MLRYNFLFLTAMKENEHTFCTDSTEMSRGKIMAITQKLRFLELFFWLIGWFRFFFFQNDLSETKKQLKRSRRKTTKSRRSKTKILVRHKVHLIVGSNLLSFTYSTYSHLNIPGHNFMWQNTTVPGSYEIRLCYKHANGLFYIGFELTG